MTDPIPKINKILVKMVWQILLLCLSRVFVAENAALQGFSGCDVVPCVCDEQQNVEIKYFEIQNFSAKAKDSPDFLSAVCESHSCTYNLTWEGEVGENIYILLGLEKKNEVCFITTSYLIYISIVPVKIVSPPLDEEAKESHSRLSRFSQSRNDSISSIRNAMIDCSEWPGCYRCKIEINCTDAYAVMKGGKALLNTTGTCQESELDWYPKAKASFPDCALYGKCKAILVKPGYIDCGTTGPMYGPKYSYCDISCAPYEDKDEVPKERYECLLDGNFAKTLPHCATIAKDENSIPFPQTFQGPLKDHQNPQKAPQRTQKDIRRP